MFKTNGMLEKGEQKEVAGKRLFSVTCTACGKEDTYKRVFGEKLVCSNCGSEIVREPIEASDV